MPRLIAAVALIIAMVSSAGAQTNERAYESLQFRTVTPGARAVAMGKAFVGIADDATAAASNPAGLSNLLHPEASAEWFGTRSRHGRFSPKQDNPLNEDVFHSEYAFPSFASFVQPLRGRLRNFTVAAFYNSLQEYEETFELPPRTIQLPDRRATQSGHFGSMDISARAAGGSVSYLPSDRVSIGGSVTIHHLSLDSVTFGGIPTDVQNGTLTDDSDVELAGQLGLLVKPTQWLSVGAAWHPGTTFQLNTTLLGCFFSDAPEHRCIPIANIRTAAIESPEQSIEYRIPNRFALGAAGHFDPLTLVFDVGFTRYSERVTDRFLIVDFLNQPSAKLRREDYFFNDAIELHTGVEYRISRRFAVRGGIFTEADSSMHYRLPDAPTDQQRTMDFQFNTLQPGTSIGATAGAGIVLGNRFQLDGAWSRSASVTDLVLSFVTRFAR